MGVPYNGSPMASHPQYLTVRNSRGREMLDVLGAELIRTPALDTGDRRPLVMQVGVERVWRGTEGGGAALIGNLKLKLKAERAWCLIAGCLLPGWLTD